MNLRDGARPAGGRGTTTICAWGKGDDDHFHRKREMTTNRAMLLPGAEKSSCHRGTIGDVTGGTEA